MLWLVRLDEFEAYLFGIRFRFVGSTGLHRVYRRGDVNLIVRVTDHLTENEMLAACEQAGVEAPDLQPYFGAP